MPLRGGPGSITPAGAPGSKPDPVLVRALRAAHAMLDRDSHGRPVLAASPTSPYRRRLVRLAFLAPQIQAAILSGRQPPGLMLARLLEADNLARKHLDKITRTFDSVRTNLEKGITHFEGELSKPVESKAAGSIAAEVRAHFKALPTGERMKLIQQAIDEGDHIVATAVLGAPAMLSGIDANMQKTLTCRRRTPFWSDDVLRLRLCDGQDGCRERTPATYRRKAATDQGDTTP